MESPLSFATRANCWNGQEQTQKRSESRAGAPALTANSRCRMPLLIACANLANLLLARDLTFQDKGVTLAGTLLLSATPGKHPPLHSSTNEGDET